RGAAYGVVGGGNTLDVVYALQLQDFFDYVSSGGGAMLKYVGGASLPALDVLKRT
ncbi:phosphoglycerate kinase, partial [Candidatus Uhrbacteria bacterium]|nr:phosphoglycerate kinase [Candidatus Uhrbacteria bacterium]